MTISVSVFNPPANIVDFTSVSVQQAQLDVVWTVWAGGWMRQAILGNPWNETGASNQTFYVGTPVSPGATPPAPVTWTAMPGRIRHYFPNLTLEEQWQLADTGLLPNGQSFPPIEPPSVVCGGPSAPDIPYGPYGPRGWQDEYCEWSVQRDEQGNIIRIDFTCENPEYWHALWRVSPERVLELYQTTLGNANITLDDLTLQFNGSPVIDPGTGQPVYNPLNPFNFGPTRTATAGGAMHLTSTPNTLQTELQLAAGATILRKGGSADPNALLCCGQYGQPFRNSDPTIGQSVNQVVQGTGKLNQVALANPIGLYIQLPTFDGWELPANAPSGYTAADFWTITRGVKTISGFPNGNFILHATYQVPAELPFTVSQITIGGVPIQWAAQIASTFEIGLFPVSIPTAMTQQPAPCVTFPDPPAASPQPLQLMHAAVWDAMYDTPIANPVGVPESLASNSVIIPAEVAPGQTYAMVLTCDTLTTPAPGLSVAFVFPDNGQVDPNITVTVGAITPVSYTVPGNSYPSSYEAVSLTVTVATKTVPGSRDVLVTNPGQAAGAAFPAALYVSLLSSVEEVPS